MAQAILFFVCVFVPSPLLWLPADAAGNKGALPARKAKTSAKSRAARQLTMSDRIEGPFPSWSPMVSTVLKAEWLAVREHAENCRVSGRTGT